MRDICVGMSTPGLLFVVGYLLFVGGVEVRFGRAVAVALSGLFCMAAAVLMLVGP